MAGQFGKLESECKNTIEHFKKELGRVRTGRASSSLLEGLNVEYYGSMVPLIQLGMISVPEPRMLVVQVYDAGAMDSVEKAIKQSDLGLNPARDGALIRVSIPALTEQRRKELAKALHKLAEETKVSVRNHRRDAIDEIKEKKKKKEMSEDDARRGEEEIQKITDKFTKEADVMLAAKEKELMDV